MSHSALVEDRYAALLVLAASLANTRTPTAKTAQLASGTADAVTAGHDRAAVQAALADVNAYAESLYRQDPGGVHSRSSDRWAREARVDDLRRTRIEMQDLLGDQPHVPAGLSEHEAHKAALKANMDSYARLGAERNAS